MLSRGLTVRLIATEREWDDLRSPWDELYALSATTAVPLSFDWLRTWWTIYGPVYGQGGLRIISLWRDARLVGVLPLFQARTRLGARHLRFISTGEAEYEETCPDYMNLLCAPGEEAACADASWNEISRLKWDHIELRDSPAGAHLAASRLTPPGVTTVARGKCPIADLTGGFDAYLSRLSANTRGQCRRLMRDGANAGVAFEIATPETADGMFEDLIKLHQERWVSKGRQGAFNAERFVKFHRTLVTSWTPSKRAILARLSIQSKSVAILYGFLHSSVFAFYQAGVRIDESIPLRSPGNLAHLLLMQELVGRGVTTYDFLRGSASYKERLASGSNSLMSLKGWRSSARAQAYRGFALLESLANRGKRVVSGVSR